MELKIKVFNDSLNDEDIHRVTNELNQAINYETDFTSILSPSDMNPGQKGDPSILGEIILTAFSSGAIVALINVIKSYINRDSNLNIDITGKNGKSIKLNAVNIKSNALDNTLSQLKMIMDE